MRPVAREHAVTVAVLVVKGVVKGMMTKGVVKWEGRQIGRGRRCKTGWITCTKNSSYPRTT